MTNSEYYALLALVRERTARTNLPLKIATHAAQLVFGILFGMSVLYKMAGRLSPGVLVIALVVTCVIALVFTVINHLNELTAEDDPVKRLREHMNSPAEVVEKMPEFEDLFK